MKKIIMTLTAVFVLIAAYGQQKHIVILHTNDMHSQIEPFEKGGSGFTSDKGGMVRVATYIEQVRNQEQNVLLLDAGDFCQGTPYYNIYSGMTEIEMMNAMRYDVGILGNHEFDLGLDNLAKLVKAANFPIVNANYEFTGTPLEGLIKPYEIIIKDGVKIGVFGLGTPLEFLTFERNIKGMKFKDIFEEAKTMAAKLKNEENCDLVICVSHIGYKDTNFNDVEIAKQSEYIDVIVGGHSHTYLEKPQEVKNKNGKIVYVAQAGSKTLFVGRIDITLEEIKTPESK